MLVVLCEPSLPMPSIIPMAVMFLDACMLVWITGVLTCLSQNGPLPLWIMYR